MNVWSLQAAVFFFQDSARIRREGEENEDDNEGTSDAESGEEEEQEEEEDDDEGQELSEYEQLRKSRILQNNRVLKALGFEPTKSRKARRGGKHGEGKVCNV